ncbi:MAG: UbiA family prenyltransferase [Magnetovibrio sp.]|nr:UbiA family prenyltransferase [Magnetovibrio sp.]
MHLITIGGWPIFFLGLASLGAGYLYSHGPYPVSRSPFGELVVIAFFGIAAVGGSVYLQTGTVSNAAWLWGLAMGLPAGAVLVLNNVRDKIGDQLAGRRTLAILIGTKSCLWLYAVLMLGPLVLAVLSVTFGLTPPGALTGLATLPLAIKNIRTFRASPGGQELNPLLGATVRFQGLFALTTCLGMFVTMI